MRTSQDCYVMFDIECSGTKLGVHDLIQFGAIAVCGQDLEYEIPFPQYRAKPELPANLIQPHFKHPPNPESMEVNGLNWDDVLAYGEPVADFIDRFHQWVMELRGRDDVDRVVLVGHGVVFDWSFLKLIYDAHRDDWPCHYSALDFKSWYGGRHSLEYVQSSMTHMRETLEIGPNPAAHDALADARYQLEFMMRSFADAGLISRADRTQPK